MRELLYIVLLLTMNLICCSQIINSNSELYKSSIDTVLKSINTEKFDEIALRLPNNSKIDMAEATNDLSITVQKGKRNDINGNQLLMIVNPIQVKSDTLNIMITLFHKPDKEVTLYSEGAYLVKYLYSELKRSYLITLIEKGIVL